MAISLNKLDNSDNLEDGRPSNTLFTYYVTRSEDFTHFEPRNPRYKALRYGEIVSLTLKITDQNNNIINNGPGINCSASYSIIKMYITIYHIKGESRIDLSYSIQNFDSNKEIAVIRMLSDNVQYDILKLREVMDPISDAKKTILRGTYEGESCFPL